MSTKESLQEYLKQGRYPKGRSDARSSLHRVCMAWVACNSLVTKSTSCLPSVAQKTPPGLPLGFWGDCKGRDALTSFFSTDKALLGVKPKTKTLKSALGTEETDKDRRYGFCGTRNSYFVFGLIAKNDYNNLKHHSSRCKKTLWRANLQACRSRL